MRYPNNVQRLPIPKIKFRACVALRQIWREGYGWGDVKADVMAGLVVGMVAIPLGMALAIASGVAPQYGLYTVIIAGTITALLGGSRFNVTGPTAAFVVILLPIAQKFGIAGLLTAGALAGIILVLLGLTGLGQAIKLIPHPVTTGFTAGIGVVIATIQIKDFLGLKLDGNPEHYLDRVSALFRALPSWSMTETGVALATLGLLLTWPKINRRIPAPLVALSAVAVTVFIIQKFVPDFQVATIGSRFSAVVDGMTIRGIPQTPPSFALPWHLAGPNGQPVRFDFALVQTLLPSAVAIALLGAIESLLCAVVADGMTQTQTKHDPDAELIALGTANIIGPFWGGIAATGAIARTATNIRFGAKSPIAAIVHAIFTFVVVLAFAPVVSYLPMAALAALLVLVAYNMSEIKNFAHVLRVAPRSDVAVLLACFSLTVIFDMVIGVTIGVLLAALLFMRRMAGLTSGKVLEGPYHRLPEQLPREVLLYEIAGPLFFGAAEKAITNLEAITDGVRVVIFVLEDVPVLDVTGLVAFETAIDRLLRHNKTVVLAGLKRQPRELLLKSGVVHQKAGIIVAETIADAVAAAKNAVSPPFLRSSVPP